MKHTIHKKHQIYQICNLVGGRVHSFMCWIVPSLSVWFFFVFSWEGLWCLRGWDMYQGFRNMSHGTACCVDWEGICAAIAKGTELIFCFQRIIAHFAIFVCKMFSDSHLKKKLASIPHIVFASNDYFQRYQFLQLDQDLLIWAMTNQQSLMYWGCVVCCFALNRFCTGRMSLIGNWSLLLLVCCSIVEFHSKTENWVELAVAISMIYIYIYNYICIYT